MTSEVYDMVAFAADLERRGRHAELRRAVRRALDVASAHQDLTDASDALDLLRRLTRAEQACDLTDMDLGTVAGALQINSIVLYTRATDTKPIDRQKWFGQDKLSPEHQVIHEEVMQLRNKELAHFGRGKMVDGSPLLAETIVLNPADPQHPYGYLTRRARNRAGLVRRLVDLVTVVQDLARGVFNRRLSEMHAELKNGLAANPQIKIWLLDHPMRDAGLLAAQGITEAGTVDFGQGRYFSGVGVEPIWEVR